MLVLVKDVAPCSRGARRVEQSPCLSTSALHIRPLLLAQGVNPRVVMETLGHSQVSLTLNTYSHVLPALQRDAAARMNAVLER